MCILRGGGSAVVRRKLPGALLCVGLGRVRLTLWCGRTRCSRAGEVQMRPSNARGAERHASEARAPSSSAEATALAACTSGVRNVGLAGRGL